MVRLSSSQTFLFKYAFTVVWPAGFALATVLAFRNPALRAQGAHLSYLFSLILVTPLLWWFCGGLKRVDLDGDHLVVSTLRRRIRVPVSSIATVHQNRWFSPRPITVMFKSPTDFGPSIVFMPPFTFNIISEDPIAARLRRLATAANQDD